MTDLSHISRESLVLRAIDALNVAETKANGKTISDRQAAVTWSNIGRGWAELAGLFPEMVIATEIPYHVLPADIGDQVMADAAHAVRRIIDHGTGCTIPDCDLCPPPDKAPNHETGECGVTGCRLCSTAPVPTQRRNQRPDREPSTPMPTWPANPADRPVG